MPTCRLSAPWAPAKVVLLAFRDRPGLYTRPVPNLCRRCVLVPRPSRWLTDWWQTWRSPLVIGRGNSSGRAVFNSHKGRGWGDSSPNCFYTCQTACTYRSTERTYFGLHRMIDPNMLAKRDASSAVTSFSSNLVNYKSYLVTYFLGLAKIVHSFFIHLLCPKRLSFSLFWVIHFFLVRATITF